MSKPTNLIYGVDERPPWLVLVLLGLQHVAVLSIAFIIPVVVGRSAGVSEADSAIVLRMAMVTMGLATILMSLRRGPVGAGQLCPAVSGPAYMSATLLALRTGGVPLVCGMMLAVGAFEVLLSRLIVRLRPLFPPEVIGLVVLMVGLEGVVITVPRCMGLHGPGGVVDLRALTVAGATFAAMVAVSVWTRGKLRLYTILIGLVLGYGLSAAAGLFGRAEADPLIRAPWFALPAFAHFGWAFDHTLLFPFLVAALASTLKGVGDLTTCQRINDAAWKRPDLAPIGRGILAMGLGNLAVGALGGMGLSSSSSNIGLAVSTGATSRAIGFCAGGLVVALAFLPKAAAVFVHMPDPVMGACLLFAISYMIVAGFQLIGSRMLDARKTFVIGVALCFGLSVDMAPELYRNAPVWLEPFVCSSLALTTTLAVLLNLLFRIGISRPLRHSLAPGVDLAAESRRFLHECGCRWGARPEVVARAEAAVATLLRRAAGADTAGRELFLSALFTEDRLTVEIRLAEGAAAGVGSLLALPLAEFHGLADGLQSRQDNGAEVLRLEFDHR